MIMVNAWSNGIIEISIIDHRRRTADGKDIFVIYLFCRCMLHDCNPVDVNRYAMFAANRWIWFVRMRLSYNYIMSVTNYSPTVVLLLQN